MRKRDTDPDPVPSEEKRTRRPALPLSDAALKLIDDTAEYVNLSSRQVIQGIASMEIAAGENPATHLIDNAVMQSCQIMIAKHEADRKAKRERIFTKDPQAVEAPILAKGEEE